MCFNQPMSGAFAQIGFIVGLWAWKETKSWQLVAGVWYFVAMETLQYFQFFWLAAGCDDPVNKALTVVGFAHICFQPYFTHLLSGAFMRSKESKAQYVIIRRLALIMGMAMFSRYLMWTPEHKLECKNTEWIRGNELCTRMGTHHLSWELPLTHPTYFMPSNNIHFFMMFAPYVATQQWIPGAILFLTGPFLSTFITDNLHEQAAIWCFFSICQVVLAVLMYRFGTVARKRLWFYKDRRAADEKIAIQEEAATAAVAAIKKASSNGTNGHANGNGKKHE